MKRSVYRFEFTYPTNCGEEVLTGKYCPVDDAVRIMYRMRPEKTSEDSNIGFRRDFVVAGRPDGRNVTRRLVEIRLTHKECSEMRKALRKANAPLSIVVRTEKSK